MIYKVEYTKEADREIAELKKSDTFSYNCISLIDQGAL